MESPGARRSNTWLYVVIGVLVACLLCACLACAILFGLSVISSSDTGRGPEPFPQVATVPVRPPGLSVTPPAPR